MMPGAIPAGSFEVQLRDDRSRTIAARTGTMLLVPFTGFDGASKPGNDGFHRVDLVENKPTSTRPALRFTSTSGGAPSDSALQFIYHFDPGWQYTEAAPSAALATIPPDADSLLLWIREDGSDNALRARFVDSTGQFFQPDMGRLATTDWRATEIPLDGKTSTAHWGGANDGVPHPPLRWDSLLLIDSANKAAPKSGEVLVAAPYYVLSNH